jgi:hypothetical protein
MTAEENAIVADRMTGALAVAGFRVVRKFGPGRSGQGRTDGFNFAMLIYDK